MEAVSPDIAKKLLTRDFANLVGRVQKGGKLTRTERAMLQSMATGTGPAPATAASYVELAAVLGITRQSINTWKKRKDAPKPAANGLHDVAAWQEFMRRNDLKGGEFTPQAGDIETSLKARKLLAEVEERELRLGIRRGEYVAVEEELIAAWGDDAWHLASPEHPFAYIKCALSNRERLVDNPLVKGEMPKDGTPEVTAAIMGFVFAHCVSWPEVALVSFDQQAFREAALIFCGGLTPADFQIAFKRLEEQSRELEAAQVETMGGAGAKKLRRATNRVS